MPSNEQALRLMQICLTLAQKSGDLGEVPIGALVWSEEHGVISEAHNLKETHKNALYHAEILAIQEASQKLGRWRLQDCSLFSTLEPCVMCSGAIVQARLGHVYFSASDPKGGGQSLYELLQSKELNHRPEVHQGLLENESRELLQQFFRGRRS